MSNSKSSFLTIEEALKLKMPWLLTIKECDLDYRKCGIYIIQFKDGIMIGDTDNINKRIEQLIKIHSKSILRTKSFKTPNPLTLLDTIKKQFKLQKVVSQRFLYNTSIEEVSEFIKKSPFYRT